jgi:peptidoglycan hydrolase CwlO-like protein
MVSYPPSVELKSAEAENCHIHPRTYACGLLRRRIKKASSIILILALFFGLFLFSKTNIFSNEGDDKLKNIQEEIEKTQKLLEETQQKKITLKNEIVYQDNQIKLTTLKIQETEGKIKVLQSEIESLSQKIEKLDISLDYLTQILIRRIVKTYKTSSINPTIALFSSKNFAQFLARYKYLRIAQENDRKIMLVLETTRTNFDDQKNLKEEKQREQEELQKKLEVQKATLAQQKKQKEKLLAITQNDEVRFQQILASARSELEAIQSIIAGKGEEKEVGPVKEGERIASVIYGSSPCSTGTHLHFEVSAAGANQNPANYLKPISVSWDNAPDGTFSFSGSWIWPMDEPIKITQGYGMTYYAKPRPDGLNYYNGAPHSGLDMDADNKGVKSVKPGKLSRGSIGCYGGTLRYVKVDHDDSDIDTYYLHINYY